MKKYGFSTTCIHSGEEGKYDIDVTPPIHLSSTFLWKRDDQKFLYSRINNPTREVLEEKMSVLEDGAASLVFSSGMAAISSVILTFTLSGGEIVASEDLYGGTKKFLLNIAPRWGIITRFVDMRDPFKIREVINEKTTLLYLETPSNPLMRLIDIKAVSKIGKDHGVKVVVDNTFASPYVQVPIELGADITIHSATKYLGGHSDLIAGVAVFRDYSDYENVLLVRNRLGSALSPFDSYLLIRSIKTLEVRMQRHCENALSIAEYLKDQVKYVDEVFYPFLKDFPQYNLARRQMMCGGGMLSFRLKTDDTLSINRFLSSLRIIKKAVSLGGVESLIEQPYSMTHAGLPEDVNRKLGITPSLIRLSVGIENSKDLIMDLENSFKNM